MVQDGASPRRSARPSNGGIYRLSLSGRLPVVQIWGHQAPKHPSYYFDSHNLVHVFRGNIPSTYRRVFCECVCVCVCVCVLYPMCLSILEILGTKLWPSTNGRSSA